jgi:flavin-dependent dehydrogenase
MVKDLTDFDVVIVGASVAGCTAALLFAQAGASVALLERRNDIAAYKVLCTHLIQSSATPVINRIGLGPLIEAAGAVRTTTHRWWTRWGWIEPCAAPGGPPLQHGYSIRRQTLDPILRQAAAHTPGVQLMLGCAVTELLREDGIITGIRFKSGDEIATIRCGLVVGADGRDSAVAKLVGARTRSSTNNRFSYFAYYRDLPGPAPRPSTVWFSDPDVAYMFPNEDGVTLVACTPSKKLLPEFRQNRDAAFEHFISALPDPPRISEGKRVSKLIGFIDYPSISRQTSGAGWALIGDAALSSDPLWGVGCGWAFQSAEWLADAYCGNPNAVKALVEYRRRHRHELRGHQLLISGFARAHPMNPIERLMFAAAARDEEMARHLFRYGSRLSRPTEFLAPAALGQAARVNYQHKVTRSVKSAA